MNIITAFSQKTDGNMREAENRKQFLKKLHLGNRVDMSMNQQHTNNVCIVGVGKSSTICDAVVTDNPQYALFVNVADCEPILMYDENRGIIAAIHAGREGVFKNIIKNTIEVFISEFNSDPKNIRVEIGPSAQKCCYEVGAETNKYLNFVRENYGEEYLHGINIDLPGITRKQLREQGILNKNIAISPECTLCNSEKYFSYRSGDQDERFAGVISLK